MLWTMLNPSPAPPPIASQPAVPPSPPVATAPPPPPPASTGEIEVVDGLSWTSSAEGNRATLTFGLPNSDQVEFLAGCLGGAGGR